MADEQRTPTSSPYLTTETDSREPHSGKLLKKKKAGFDVLVEEPIKDKGTDEGKKSTSILGILQAHRQSKKDVGQLFDELILDLGGYGLYQQRIVYFVVLPCFFMLAFVQCVVGFVVTSPPEFWCKIPELDGGHLMPNGLGLNKTERLTLTPSDHSCHMYNINYTDMLVRHDLNVAALAHYLKKAQPNVTRCRDGWTFDVEHNDTNIVTEWDLVCDASTLMTLATALMAVAAICGTLVAGYVSDRWGRKKPFFFFFFIMVVFGISFAFAPSFEGFLILAIIHSFGSGPVYYILYTMAVEMLTSTSRLSMVVGLSIVYAIGSMLFTLIAYFVQHWRNLTIYGTSPFALIFIFWFFLPESPRWLLVREKFTEVEVYVRRVAAVNCKPFNESCQTQLKQIFLQCTREVDLQNVELVDSFDGSRIKRARVWCSRRGSWVWLFATPPMLRKTLLLTYLICTLQICYYGLREYTPAFAESDSYFDHFISTLIELPGFCFAWLICGRFGRRISVMIAFFLAFLTCLLTLAFSVDQEFFMGKIAVFLIARIFIASAYVTGELLMYETFPTVVRMQGVAFVETIASVFSHTGSAIVGLQSHSLSLPLVVFGCLALIAVLSVFLLPETISTALPETVEEADMRDMGLFRRAVNFRVPVIKIKKHPFVSFHKSDEHGGDPAVTMNEQMPATQTPIVVTMPADSVRSPAFLAPAVTVAPEVQTIGGQPSTVTMGIERPSNNPVVNRSEIERVAASLKRVPPSKQNKSVHFTVGADARIRDDDGVPEDRRGSDPV